ncbi:hypothetical protein PUN28_013424 [Cardiocondyla obscurior]|uniref:Uncharacterized protein n=1 Tax=Cardiocondyla obscurior TaxID=286306 RepID=A0AAW2F4X4_9HYME
MIEPSTPDSTNTLQSEFRFGALGTKGSRRKLTKETVRRPGEAAEVPLTIPGAREKSSTYPILQIALTLCRVWRFGDERFATETNQGNRPETRGSRRSSSDHSWCKRKILDLPNTPDSTNTLQSEFRFGALGTKGSRRKLTKEIVRRPGEAAEVPLTIPGAREKFSTYPILQIALTLCRVNSGSRRKLTKETVWRPGEAAEVSLTIPGAREKSSTYPVLQIALTLCRIFGDWCSARFCVFLECPVGFFIKFEPLFCCPKSFKALHGRELFFISVLKVTDSCDCFVVTGMLRGSQKFHCASELCEKCSAAFTTVPLDFLLILKLPFAAQKVPSLYNDGNYFY